MIKRIIAVQGELQLAQDCTVDSVGAASVSLGLTSVT